VRFQEQKRSDLVANNEKYIELAKQLDTKKGQTPAQHAMQLTQAGGEESLAKCPYLSHFPHALRTAQRESNARTYNRRFPISVVKAQGLTLTDTAGNKYLDFLGCAGTLALGHNHPVITETIRDFVANDRPAQILDFMSPIKDEFITQLFKACPPAFAKNAKIQFCGPAGTDAAEAALKLAKNATGRHNIIAFHGAYHGHTNGALAMMGNLDTKGAGINLMPGVHFMPFPYSYRCPFGLHGEEGSKMASLYLENVLEDIESGIVKPAAVILECVQGEGGVIPAPVSFLKEVRRITEKHGILMICDEIQAGMGRTGKMFAFEHAEIVPDIVLISKAVGGGLPMAVMMYNHKLDVWSPGTHAGTFRGNQMAMATGAAGIKYMLSEGLVGQAAVKGAKLMANLQALAKQVPEIGDVRGRGLMIGVETVDTSKPAVRGAHPAFGEFAARVQANCFRRGMIIEKGGRHGAVLRFLPPLVVSDAEIDQACGIFEVAVKEARAWAHSHGK
jgi:diaminobutyrate-2-oxoglutarate transaminase